MRLTYFIKIGNVPSVATTLVIRVLDILAHILPGEKGLESGDLGSVMTNLENEVDD